MLGLMDSNVLGRTSEMVSPPEVVVVDVRLGGAAEVCGRAYGRILNRYMLCRCRVRIRPRGVQHTNDERAKRVC